MVNTVKNETAVELGKMLEDHKAENITVLNVRAQSSWTDYFIIATVRSQGHLKGLMRFVREFIKGHGLDIEHSQKRITESGWLLIDCGALVIHLMSEEMRSFYELERVWYEGETLYQSSKSS